RLRGRVRYRLVSIVHHLRCSELRAPGKNALYRAIEARYLSSVDGFVFNSQTTRAAVENLVTSVKDSIIAYPAGDQLDPDISPERIEDRCRAPGPIRVLFVGSLIRRKELHTLISAIALLPPDLCRLDVVGGLDADTAYVREIRAMIEQEKVSGHVRLLGPVDQAELYGLLARSHVMAVPSSYEGFGIVYVEGMGFGLPAIASTAGAAHEIITHNLNGFLVNPGDPEQLSSCIRELSVDRDRLTRMSLAALDRYRAHPTWDDGGEIIRRFLKGMAP
ncbi:MAG: glycosyltransferase family 4 protein, partial [Deltaproteobacteria bacterium]